MSCLSVHDILKNPPAVPADVDLPLLTHIIEECTDGGRSMQERSPPPV